MSFARSWQHTLWRLAAWYAAVLAVATPLGLFWLGLALASVVAMAWQYRRLSRVLQRIAARRWYPSPIGWGIWGELEAQLHRRQREERRRRVRLSRILRAFREAAAALPDATLVLERGSHEILWFNEAAVRLFGLRYPQDIGARFTNLVRSPRVATWISSLQSDEPLLDVASPVDDQIRLSLRLIPYTEGQSLLVARDITKLTHLEQVRRDFVANVSHELRTPLTVVHGYLDVIDPEDHPELAAMIAEMRRQSQRMTQIVEDLLTLSRLEAQDRLVDEQVAMSSLLATLRREATALSQGRHEITFEDSARVDLTGSVKELHSAFSNLVSNAVRYTPDGGRIAVRFRRDDGSVVLEVEDTGQGIPPQHLPRITERFYRVSTSRSRDTGGTGLGLSIVKHVLNLHQAKLEIESEVGRGSTFRCRFGNERTVPRESAAA